MFELNVFAIALTCALLHISHCVDRVHYVAIEEVQWDYAPTGTNVIEGYSLDDNEDSSVFTKNGPDRIGRVYWKAVFREYTDETYTTKSARPESLGLLGPVLKAEVGDTLIIHAINKASIPYSFHPHGVIYTKSNEGALYSDNTQGVDKDDDAMAPQSNYTYTWEIKSQHGPSNDGPNCNTFIYHSHVDAEKDTNSGLVGPLIVCRPGTLDSVEAQAGIDKEFYLLFTVMDENLSWYLDKNIDAYCGDASSVDVEDEDFQESNKMHGLNGRMYGNLEGLETCEGDKVAWHVFGLGTEVDVHTAYFQGQSVTLDEHTDDTFNLFPASFISSTMIIKSNPTPFRISCLTNDHYSAGMQAQMQVNADCTGSSPQSFDASGTVRSFYVAAEEVFWNYAPDNFNYIMDDNLTTNKYSSVYFDTSQGDRIGSTYKKAQFIGYTDETFQFRTKVDVSNGILGPLLYGETGDQIKVVFNNTARYDFNIEPHGLTINNPGITKPGELTTYTWNITAQDGPGSKDDDCIQLMYASMVDPVKDTNSGLVGPLIICKPGTLSNHFGETTYNILMTIFDENSSHYIDENIATYIPNRSTGFSAEDEGFVESNNMASLNGFMYGNLKGLKLCMNQKTHFGLMGIGTEPDVHAFILDGISIAYRTERVGAVKIFPHTTSFLTVKPEVLGSNFAGCYLNDHITQGLLTTYEVVDCGAGEEQTAESGVVRMYYIAAEEEVHNYNPSRTDMYGNSVDDPESKGYTFAHQEDGKRIGSQYIKAMYFEYTDSTFEQRVAKPTYLGALGPIIAGEEGDTIVVVFKNNASFEYNMYAVGLPMKSQMLGQMESAKPGQTIAYTWKVRSSSVPSSDKPACQSQLYMSTVDKFKDPFSGLIGPVITCRRGALTDGTMDRSYFELFMIFDENKSHYIDRNIERFAKAEPATFDKDDEDFNESNLMHSINGWIYGVDGLNLYFGAPYLWHVAAFGIELDLHTVHFHGNMYKHFSDIQTNSDVFTMIPGMVVTLEMVPDAVGSWLSHCHVNDHISAGMVTTYHVSYASSSEPENKKELPEGYSEDDDEVNDDDDADEYEYADEYDAYEDGDADDDDDGDEGDDDDLHKQASIYQIEKSPK